MNLALDRLGPSAATSAQAGGTAQPAGANALTDSDPKAAQDKFLKLLVTQLKNQDPLSPMDNAQVTTQIAQLNTVTGIQDLNKSMQAISQSLGSAQVVQSTALLGKSVLTEGNSVGLSGQPVTVGLDFSGAADTATLNIVNSLGQTVATRSLGAVRAGLQTVQFDGRNDEGAALPSGQYTFSVQASANNQRVNATPFQLNVVKSLENLGPDGIRITTQNGSTVSLSDVRQVF